MRDEQLMNRALELAAQAKGRTSPNPMVGAVIVKDGVIVGEGYHKKAGTPHAEVYALQMAGEKAQVATMYVTLEPCAHFGRTPPCCDSVIAAGIREVFVAMEDPNELVAGKGIQRMREAGITVHVGLLEEKARKLNEVFLKYITTKKPFVVLKSAMTLDGKIATHTGHSKWITGEAARHRVQEMRNEYDSILVGINTVIADDPALTCRLPEGGKDPVRIIMDSQARTPLHAKVFNKNSEAPVYIVVSEKASEDRLNGLKQMGANILTVSLDNRGRLDLNEVMKELGLLGITSILVEGGSEISASFLECALVDKVVTFIAPKIVGGTTAPTPIGGIGVQHMSEAILFKNIQVHTFDNDICVEGYPEYLQVHES